MGSARYAGMAGARAALGGDVSVIRENPGGLAMYLDKHDVSITPSLSFNNNGDTKMTIGSAAAAFVLNNNHKAHGLVSSVLGVGYHQTRDFSRSTNEGGSKYDEAHQSGMITAGYGMNFGNRHFVGFGINCIHTHYLQNSTTSDNAATEFDTESLNWNMKIGGIFKLLERLNLALVFQTPTISNMEEDAHFNGKAINDCNKYEDMQYRQWEPLKLQAGLAYLLGANTSFDIDYSFQNFGAGYVGNSNERFDDVEKFMSDHFKSCHTIKGGFETTLFKDFSLRLGVAYVSSPTSNPNEKALEGKDIQYAVSLPQSSIYYCGGLGYSFLNFFYTNVAYVYKSQDETFYPQITNLQHSSIKVSNNTSNLLLSIGARF